MLTASNMDEVYSLNIYDIAREAEVSISTVSRVLNNKNNVTPATREKIQVVLDKYSYTPSAIARGLVARSMKTVAILTEDVRVPQYARTTYIVEQAFSKLGYNVMVCNTGGEAEETRQYIRTLADRQIDGVLLVGPVFNELGRDAQAAAALKPMSVVIAGGQLDLPGAYSVLVDDMHGSYLAVEHLVKKGHKDLMYIKNMNAGSGKGKHEGFVTALERLGLKYQKSMTLTTAYGLEGGRQAALQILKRSCRPTAIVCDEDLTAVGVVKTLTAAGLRVPRDMAVVGGNNSEYSVICTPELTTIDNKVEMSALLSVQLLESRITGGSAFSSMKIEPELVVRQST